MLNKVCNKCGFECGLDDVGKYFYRYSIIKGGFQSRCKKCDNIHKKQRYRKNIECSREYNRDWYYEHGDILKERRLPNKEKISKYHRERNALLKREILGYYSDGTFCCKCCGENIYEFLTIDHINGLSQEEKEERKRRKSRGGERLYHRLKKENFPEGFQVLCMNCNFTKGLCGECPHKVIKVKIACQ